MARAVAIPVLILAFASICAPAQANLNQDCVKEPFPRVQALGDFPSATPAATTDPQLCLSWSLMNYDQPMNLNGKSRLWDIQAQPDADIDALEGWALSRGEGVTVAVIDSGIDTSHPELSGQLLEGHNFLTGQGDVDEKRFSHGTSVAGIIAARAGNGAGSAGVAPQARIMPLQAIDSQGRANASAVEEAINYAGRRQVKVVNISLGGLTSDVLDYSFVLYPQTLFVATAGNRGRKLDPGSYFPCQGDAPNLICVASSDPSDQRTSDSNWGPGVDVFAPGDRIWAPSAGGSTGTFSGTSAAAPQVSGIAALIASRWPQLTGAQLRAHIIATQDSPRELNGFGAMVGRVNAFRALTSEPKAAGADADSDGLDDGYDLCPAQAGILAGKGCPHPQLVLQASGAPARGKLKVAVNTSVDSNVRLSAVRQGPCRRGCRITRRLKSMSARSTLTSLPASPGAWNINITARAAGQSAVQTLSVKSR